MNIFAGNFRSTLRDCWNYPSKEAEEDVLLLQKEYNNFRNIYAWINAHPSEAKKQILEIKKKFDTIFKKIGLSDDFIDKLWDKHGCWKYFPSVRAIIKKYRNNYDKLHDLLREIDYWRICNYPTAKKKAVENMIQELSGLMEEKDLNDCLTCIFEDSNWKKHF